MKTMFLSHDGVNSSNKRKFQKPNILRRKTKEPEKKPGFDRTFETLVSVDSASEPRNLYCVPKEVIINRETIIPMTHPRLPDSRDSNAKLSVLNPHNVVNIQLQQNHVNLSKNSGEHVSQCAVLNVESFLNGSALVQSTTENENSILNQDLKRGWRLDFVDEHNEPHQIIIEDTAERQQVRLHSADGSTVECIMPESVMSEAEVPELTVENSAADEIRMTNVIGTLVTTNIMAEESTLVEENFECDTPGCNKRFKTKERLTRHKRTHLPSNKSPKEPRHMTVECPARKKGSKEVAVCGELFLFREALTKHIKEHHTLDDAMYICSICGRRFFWCVGLRAHGRSHLARARTQRALVCTWEGCGRSFMQPCRLREHQRAHTGDKPYPCNYPNCNWSFRTASKLLRHARQHTGERRHACTVCGHAFPRREHLRKHTACHHARPHYCAHQGCQRRFMSVEALNRHMRTRHNRDHFSLDDTDTTDSAKPDSHWDMFTITESADKTITIKSTLSESNTTAKVTKTGETKKQTKTKAQSKKNKETNEWKACFCSTTSDDAQGKSQEPKWNYPTENETDNDWQITECADKTITITSTISESNTTAKVTKTGETKKQTKTKAQSKKNKETNEWKACFCSTTSDDAQDKSQEPKWNYPTENETDNHWQVYGSTAESGNALEGEWHAARTHCPWPLAPRPTEAFTLQEDVQVELSEGSESNTYTIRSDLFLHGNLITNEDSEHIPSAAVSLPSTATDSGLSLLDAHPATDLMQEDLMYSDAAVDESSFRVLLLNGDSNLY